MLAAAAAAAAALALLTCAGAALARDQLGGRDAVVIDSQKAYIFYRATEPGAVRFLREVTPAQRSAWLAERAGALARARARSSTPVSDATFAYAPPERHNFVTVARGPQFSHEPDGYTYLIAVPPGTYVLYGPLGGASGGGAFGALAGVRPETCLCMGSVRFEARAGQIVDIGRIRYPVSDDEETGTPARLSSIELRPPSATMTVPDRLRGLPLVRAELRAADKMPNYFGVQIDRHPPLRGVLAYQRDRVIDVRTGQPLASAQ
jgi:hypothetical protein